VRINRSIRRAGVLSVICFGCGATSSVTLSPRQLALSRALNERTVSESPLKRETVELAQDGIRDTLRGHGLGEPYTENWRVVQDGPLTFIAGSAAKTRTDIYGFLFVFRRDSGLVYYEVGRSSKGAFPTDAQVIH
jgi:hypothetical protein